MHDVPETFDLIIIGSGSGNHLPSYLDGWKIAIVERSTFGGTCLNVGCIPSKMLVVPADRIVDAADAPRLGVDLAVGGADWPAIRDRVFGRIDPISEGGRRYRAEECPGITLIEGTARFVDERVVAVDERVLTAPKILVAAGSRPVVPPISGLAETGFHTSDTIMRLDELPLRLGIIGGGFIAAEMGHVFSAFGSEVTVFNRRHGLLRAEDHEISERFTELFGRRVTLRLGHLPDAVRRRGAETVVTWRGEELVFDQLLVAAGREPNTDLLAADRAGLACHSHGTLVVDDQMRTTVDGVYAIGDIANTHQLKHVANREADVAFWNIAHPDEPRSVDHRAIPSAVFSHPQVARVGLTEAAARAAGRDVAVGRRDYGGTAYGWALEDETSFAKVLVDRSSGLIVGAHVLGPQASVLIQPLVQAMHFGQTAAELATGPYWIHPALTEVVENAVLDAIEQI